MRREKPKATSARADRFISVAPHRSESADGGIAWRPQGNADRREDSPCRIVGGGARGNRAGAQSCSDRECAEPVQYRGPEMGKDCGLLRERESGLYAMVAGWRKAGLET